MKEEWPQEILDSQLCPTIVHDLNDQVLFRGLSVRMGANFGMPSFSERDPMTHRTDYHGVAVIVAARLQALAKGGQTLISDAFYRQLQLEQDVSWGDYGFVEVGELHSRALSLLNTLAWSTPWNWLIDIHCTVINKGGGCCLKHVNASS